MVATSVKLTFGAPAMGPVVEALGRVAKTRATVLLQRRKRNGQGGRSKVEPRDEPTRKEAVHRHQLRRLDRGAARERAVWSREGLFHRCACPTCGRIELADGGTFFLDEVGELKPSLQAKLLRVLEECRFERLGGSASITVDVRWVAATNRDLRAMAHDGTWREDLYHRLAVFLIRLPPLRERREDIVPLAESLVAHLSVAAGRSPPVRLDDDVKARLRSERWPGNVRELRNVLERAVILTDGPVIRRDHLWIEASPALTDAAAGRSGEGLLSELERQTILRTLTAVGGNRRLAATKLGIGLRTLYES